MDFIYSSRYLNDTSMFVSITSTLVAKLLAIVSALCGAAIALLTIYSHLMNYNKPNLQKSIIRLLLFVPIYAVLCILIILFPKNFTYFEIGSSIWEAIVVYSFFSLILEYCGGEAACALLIAEHPGLLRHPWPMSWFFRYIKLRSISSARFFAEFIPLDNYFLKLCKRTIFIYILINPINFIIWIILYEIGVSSNIYLNIFHQIIYNAAIFCALYALVLVYLATRQLSVLRNTNPIWKFISIKIIIVLTWYQSLLLFFIFGFNNSNVVHLNNWIFCIELPILAIIQSYAFPSKEFIPDNSFNNIQTSTDFQNNNSQIGIESQSYNTSKSSPLSVNMFKGSTDDYENAIRNAKDVVLLKDVVSDAFHNFSKKYNNHSLLHNFEVNEEDQFMNLTKKENVSK